jgi:5-methyltetrahydrofolate--homocysteine methyltransferase
METILKSAKKTVTIGPEKPIVLIGERINPTGKKRLAAALAKGNLEIVRQEAETQVAAGADVLDINVSIPEVSEVVLLPKAVRLVLETSDVPICIDTTNPAALRAALDVYKKIVPEGKPIINSVNGDEASLKNVLPLAVEYGTAVIILAMDDKGIPPTAEKRLLVVRNIIDRAEALGIPRADLVVDCLALTVGVDSRAALVTLETIRRVREEFGVNLTFGGSNISFGLPERIVINQAFLALAVYSGVNCPIVDVAKVRPFILSIDLLMGRDNYAMRYVRAYRKRMADTSLS